MFAKDNRTERLLDSFGVAWKWSNNVTFDDLVPEWNRKNQGRSKATHDDVIQEYAQRWEDGSIPPAPILRVVQEGLDPLDGIQRLSAAALRNITRVSAYVVTTDSKVTALSIRILANKLLAGHPEPDEWSRRKAVEILVIDNGMSCEEVARLGGWKVKAVQDEKTFQEWGFKMRCAGIPNRLHKGIVLAAAKYGDVSDFNHKPVVEFFTKLADPAMKLTNGEAEPFIKEMLTVKRSGKDIYSRFAEKLEDFSRNPEIVARVDGRHQPQRPDMKLTVQLKRAKTIADELASAGVAIRYVDECFLLLNQIRTAVEKIRDNSLAAK